MYSVIIADDEYDIRQGLKQVIDWEAEGFVVVAEAEDGDEALELYRRERPNLLITDIKMPGRNGLQLARAVKELDEQAQIIILSGYDDFAYAKEAIQHGVNSYLLKPVDEDELRAVLGSIRRTLEEAWSSDYERRRQERWMQDYFLRKLIRGESIEGEAASPQHWQTLLGRHYFRVLLVELVDYGDMLLELSESEVLLMRFAVRNILEDLARSFGDGFVFEESEQRLGLLLVGEERELSIEAIRPLLQQILEFTNRYARQRVRVGAGATVGRSTAIARSGQQAGAALGRAFFQPEAGIYIEEAALAAIPAWSLDWRAEPLKEAVRLGDRTGWERELQSLLRELEQRAAPLSAVRSVIVAVILQLSELVLAEEGDWKQLYAACYGETDWIAGLRRQEEAREALARLCERVSEFLRRTRETPPASEIAGVVAYIREHYREDINLKKMAGMFYITSGYLGQLFKKETGRYFNDFINEIRIEQAKRLLREPRWSIAEIAEKVGYKNTNHLYLHFKNYAGISPGDFRKQCQE